MLPKEIFVYKLSSSGSRKYTKQWYNLEILRWDKKVNVNHITDVKEFKKDNSNFITLNLHETYDFIEWLNRELVDLINDDVTKLIIDFANEGLVRESWFFAIHRMIKKYKIKSSKIYFISCDIKLSENYDTWTEKYNVPKINIIELNRYLEEAKLWIEDIDKFPIEDFKVDRVREKKFTCLNGSYREHRIIIVSELFRNGWRLMVILVL